MSTQGHQSLVKILLHQYDQHISINLETQHNDDATQQDQQKRLKRSKNACNHTKILKYYGMTHCSDCGLALSFQENHEIEVFREQTLNHEADVSPAELYITMLEDEKKMTHVEYIDQTAISQEQQSFKRILIDWLFEIGERFMQSNLTIHISITYLERAYCLRMDKGRSQQDLRLLAITCLLLAAKYDELDDKIPFISDLSHIYKDLVKIEHKEMLQLESKILYAFNWDLMILTPLHFVHALISQGIVFDTDKIKSKKTQKSSTTHSQKVLSSVRKYAEFFADLATHQYELKKYKCSQIGLAAILCARKINSFQPIWNTNFEYMAKYKYHQVEKPFKQLYKFYKESFLIQPQQAKENISESFNKSLYTQQQTNKKVLNTSDKQINNQTNIYSSKKIDFQYTGTQTVRQSDTYNTKQKAKLNLMQISKNINNIAKKVQLKKPKDESLKKQIISYVIQETKNAQKIKEGINSMINYSTSNKENYQSIDSVKNKTQQITNNKKRSSQIKDIRQHIRLSSEKKMQNSQNPQNTNRNDQTSNCKSQEPQKQMILDLYQKMATFNPKNEYFGHQIECQDSNSYSISPIRQEDESKKRVTLKDLINKDKNLCKINIALLNNKQKSTKKLDIEQPMITQSLSLSNLFQSKNCLRKQASTQNIFKNLTNITISKANETSRRQSVKHSNNNIEKSPYKTQVKIKNQENQLTSKMLNRIESTKEIIKIMQNNLTMNQKSKSVENLAKVISNKNKKSFVQKMAQQLTNRENISHIKIMPSDQSLNYTTQYLNNQVGTQSNKINQTQQIPLNNSNIMFNNITQITNNNNNILKQKIPTMNSQMIDQTKKRILSILNNKLTKKSMYPQLNQISLPLSKCSSSTYIGKINTSSMFNLKTQSARDTSQGAMTIRQSLTNTNKSIAERSSTRENSNKTKRSSLQRVAQKGILGLNQCSSTSYLYVVDEEEKIQSIANSLCQIQKQKQNSKNKLKLNQQ